jgi:hypothetical protein
MFTFPARAVIAGSVDDKRYHFTLIVRVRAVIPPSAEDKAVAKGWPFARFGCYGNSSHKITCLLGFVHTRFPCVHSYCMVGIDNKGCSFMFTFRARAVIARSVDKKRYSFTLIVGVRS